MNSNDIRRSLTASASSRSSIPASTNAATIWTRWTSAGSKRPSESGWSTPIRTSFRMRSGLTADRLASSPSSRSRCPGSACCSMRHIVDVPWWQRQSEGEGLTERQYNRMVVSMQTTLDFDRVFGALADGTRRDIVRRAIDGQEGVAELAGHYPMSFAAVQKHVAILERAGLVTKERIGRRKVVRANLEGLRVARRLLDQYEELWRGRVDRMTTLVTLDTKETDR